MLAWSVAIFCLASIVRLPAVSRYSGELERPEPVAIALSLATTGRYADAYGPGVGPTAHVAPFLPLLLSVVFRILGTGKTAAIAMSVLGSAAASLAFALLPALALAARLDPAAGILGGLAGALLPFNFWSQTNGSFEAPYTAAAFVFICILFSNALNSPRLTPLRGLAFGFAAALASTSNFSLLPVVFLWLVLLAARHGWRLGRVLPFCAATAFAIVATLSPWAIHNHRALGAWIWTRSNFALELYVSNNDVVTADADLNMTLPAYRPLHPFLSEVEREKVHQQGEVAYNKEKMKIALAWIASHRERFLELTAARFSLFWFPRMHRPWQSAGEALLTVAALGGLIVLFRAGAPFAWTAAALFAGYSPVYYLLHISPRYHMSIEPFLFLLATCLPLSLRDRFAPRVEA